MSLRPDVRVDAERVRRMNAQIRHRGPDGEGLWSSPDGRAVFGHRRLSVIDIAGGSQPMLGKSGKCAIVFNGEIYNYRELRQELERRGESFRTQSDTEVLLRWFEIESDSCLNRTRGMFALAIWDGNSDRLVLARDRVGKKPLFFTEADGILYFASTLAALREGVGRKLALDLGAIDDFLSLGFIPAPRTAFSGVNKLPAATLLVAENATLRTHQYWRADDPRDEQIVRPNELTDVLEEKLSEAVRLRLRSDVPLGIFLSGGIDSSLVTALAARDCPGIQTFSIAFEGAPVDESKYAEQVSRELRTQHRSFKVREQLLDLLPELVRHAGEPFADASALPLWLLAREARPRVTVALGGDGGDEGFAGYPWYGRSQWLERRRAIVPTGIWSAASRFARFSRARSVRQPSVVSRIGRGLAWFNQPTAAARYSALRVHLHADDVERLYAGSLREARADHRTAEQRIANAYAAASGDALRRMRIADLEMYLADGLMPKSDVATMAHALELRSPLLDHEVLALGLSLTPSQLEDEYGGKRPLRALLTRYLPASVINRPKQGFVVPLREWFRDGLRSRAEHLARSEPLHASRCFVMSDISRLTGEHLDGARDHSQRLFNLVVLDEWLRQEQPPTP